MNFSIKPVTRTSIIVILMSLAISCVPIEKLKYFNDIESLPEPSVNPRGQKIIQPFDKLYIQILSIDERTNQLFNSNGNASNTTNLSLIGNYVDEAGFIDYPFAGKIKVSGLTTSEAGQKIEEALNEYVTNAAVTVRFIDNNITLVGEVVDQGTFTFNQEKLNIYEALALGGGLTRFGDRKNVVLIRQEGDKVVHHKLNLSDSQISGKSNYYVMANDVIVVEPIRNLSFNYGNNTYLIFLNSVTTLVAILLLFGI